MTGPGVSGVESADLHVSALDEPVPRVEPRRTVAYVKSDLDDLLRLAHSRGEVVLYAPGEGRVELTPDPGIRGRAEGKLPI